MTPADLARLHARCFTTPRPWSEAEFGEVLGSAGAFLIAEAAGFVIGRTLAGEAELLTLAVAPEARRAGTGRRLVARFLGAAAARGATAAYLEVAEDNDAALRLYAGQGFAEAGRRRGYYVRAGEAPLDAIVMTRLLTRG